MNHVARFVLSLGLLLASTTVANASVEDALNEFLDGHRVTFSTRDRPGAKGVDLEFSCPGSWKESADYPDDAPIDGTLLEVRGPIFADGWAGIIVQDSDVRPGGEAEYLLNVATLRSPSGTINDSRIVDISGVPVLITEEVCQLTPPLQDKVLHSWTLWFFVDKKKVNVRFNGYSNAYDPRLSQRAATFRRLFNVMIESIVVSPPPPKSTTLTWEQVVAGSREPPAEEMAKPAKKKLGRTREEVVAMSSSPRSETDSAEDSSEHPESLHLFDAVTVSVGIIVVLAITGCFVTVATKRILPSLTLHPEYSADTKRLSPRLLDDSQVDAGREKKVPITTRTKTFMGISKGFIVWVVSPLVILSFFGADDKWLWLCGFVQITGMFALLVLVCYAAVRICSSTWWFISPKVWSPE